MSSVLTHLLTFGAGLAVLWVAGEALVRGAARLARSLGVSALVVGLTIVAFGTSAPEVAVSVLAALQGEDELALGNVIGSNIANVLLILGVAALTRPLKVSLNLIRTDVPIMIFVFAAFTLLAVVDLGLDRWEGLLFVAGLVAYTAFTYLMARREPQLVRDEYEAADLAPAPGDPRRAAWRFWRNMALVLIGIAGLVLGARLIVSGAVGLAEIAGLSRRVIALTIVAVGTSLPELATCVVAARRNQPDIAVGNIVGSNIFNVLSVAGLSAIARPLVAPPEILNDGMLMLATGLLTWIVCWRGRTVGRGSGTALLALYAVFLACTLARLGG